MIKMSEDGLDHQVQKDINNKCNESVSVVSTDLQDALTPNSKVQNLHRTQNCQFDTINKHLLNNRRTSTRRSTSVRSDSDAVNVVSTSDILTVQPFSCLKTPEPQRPKSPTFKVPPVTTQLSHTSMICRLPLGRLKSIVNSLNMEKRNSNLIVNPNATLESNEELAEKQVQKSSEITQLYGKTQQHRTNLLNRLLCLYCDRTFSNHKLMFKHTERVHTLSKKRHSTRGRLAADKEDISLCCTYCCKSRTRKSTSSDLSLLFKHLMSAHPDRYYACEFCIIRFPSDEVREAHIRTQHIAVHGARPKSKAALKAFNVNFNNANIHHIKRTVHTNSKEKSSKCFIGSEVVTLMPLSVTDPDKQVVDVHTVAKKDGEQIMRLRCSARNRARQSLIKVDGECKSKTAIFKQTECMLMDSEEPMLLSRLGIVQHRLPRQSRRLLKIASSYPMTPSKLASSSSLNTVSATHTTARTSARKKQLLHSIDRMNLNTHKKATKPKNARSTFNSLSISTVQDDRLDIDPASRNSDINPTRGKTVGLITNNGSNCRTEIGAVCTPIIPTVGDCANNNTSCTCSTGCNNNSSTASCSGAIDESFYKNVPRNVNNNLRCNLDGKLLPLSSDVEQLTTADTDSKLFEATDLPGLLFPTLLTVEQYGTESLAEPVSFAMSPMKTKKTITKNSWKWKWDFVKKYTYVNENGRIVKKIKQPSFGLRDLTKLDMWTQVTMRTKHEKKCRPPTCYGAQLVEQNDAFSRHEKLAMVDQLDQILDGRLKPQIDLEQYDQRIIKIEQIDQQLLNENENPKNCTTGDQSGAGNIVMNTLPSDHLNKEFQLSLTSTACNDHYVELGSMPLDRIQELELKRLVRNSHLPPVILSGEWARPRCYVCYGCGEKFCSLKQVEEHRIFRHPHVYSTFYEIVGRELIEKQLYTHLYIPFGALAAHSLHYLHSLDPNPATGSIAPTTYDTIVKSDEDQPFYKSNTRKNVSLASFERISITKVATQVDTETHIVEDDVERHIIVCSKCQRKCHNMLVLYAHMLHCSNDYIWLQAKKRMKYRRTKRRRGSNRNILTTVGLSCATPSIATVRKAQHQNTTEALDNVSVIPPSDKHGAVVIKRQETNNTMIDKFSQVKNKPKSPKRGDTDSDIVQRILDNLPTKRNSRQLVLSPTKLKKERNIEVLPSKALACEKAAKGSSMSTISLVPSIARFDLHTEESLPPDISSTTSPSETTVLETNFGSSEDSNVTPADMGNIVSIGIRNKSNIAKYKRKLTLKNKMKMRKAYLRKNVGGDTRISRRLKLLRIRARGNRSFRNIRVRNLTAFRHKKLAKPSINELKGTTKPSQSINMLVNSPESAGQDSKTMALPNDTPVEKEQQMNCTYVEDIPSIQKNAKSMDDHLDIHSNEKRNIRFGHSNLTNSLVEEPSKTSRISVTSASNNSRDCDEKHDIVDNNVNKESSSNSIEGQDDVQVSHVVDRCALLEEPHKVTNEANYSRSCDEEHNKSGNLLPFSEKSGSYIQPNLEINNYSFCKRRPKKLNDCIAMLTGKLSERMGVDFFNTQSPQQTITKAGEQLLPTKQSSFQQKSVSNNASTSILEAVPIATSVHSNLAVTSIMRAETGTPDLTLDLRRIPQDTDVSRMTSPRSSETRLQAILATATSPSVNVVSIVQNKDQGADEPLNLSKNAVNNLSKESNSTQLDFQCHQQLLTQNKHQHQRDICHLSPRFNSNDLKFRNQRKQLLSYSQMYLNSHLGQNSFNNEQSRTISSNSPLGRSCGTLNHSNSHSLSDTKTTKTGNGNLSSIKLPSGLIIEPVGYKQTRTMVSKEAPSVSIVARQRHIQNNTHSASQITSEYSANPCPKFDSNGSTQQNYCGYRHHMKQLDGCSSNNVDAVVRSTDQLPRTGSILPVEKPTQTVVPFLENRISVTITEAKLPKDLSACNIKHDYSAAKSCKSQSAHFQPLAFDAAITSCDYSKSPMSNSSSAVPPTQQSVPNRSQCYPNPTTERVSHSPARLTDKTPTENPHQTTLIIPHVPMPNITPSAMTKTTRQYRRNGLLIEPYHPNPNTFRDVKKGKKANSTIDVNSTILTPEKTQITSSENSLCKANTLSSLSFSWLPPLFVGGPVLELELKRLAAVALSTNNAPHPLPALSVPLLNPPSVTLLEKIIQPIRNRSHVLEQAMQKDQKTSSMQQAVNEVPKTLFGQQTSSSSPTLAVNKQPLHHIDPTGPPSCIEENPSDEVSAMHSTTKTCLRACEKKEAMMQEMWNLSVGNTAMEKEATSANSRPKEASTTSVQPALLQSTNEKQETKFPESENKFVVMEPSSTKSVLPVFAAKNEKVEKASNRILNGKTEIKNKKTASKFLLDGEHMATQYASEDSSRLDRTENNGQDSPSKQPSIVDDAENCSRKPTITIEIENHDPFKHANNSIKPDTINEDTLEEENIQKEVAGNCRNQQELLPNVCVTPTSKIIRKRRKNELASILSDQLLESFKEVDKSRLNDLKILHDITCESPDVKFTLEQIPQLEKRKSNLRVPKFVPQSVSSVSKQNNMIKKISFSQRSNSIMEDDRNAVETKNEGHYVFGSSESGKDVMLTDEVTNQEHMASDDISFEDKKTVDVEKAMHLQSRLRNRRNRRLSVDNDRQLIPAGKTKRMSKNDAPLDKDVPKVLNIEIALNTKSIQNCAIPDECDESNPIASAKTDVSKSNLLSNNAENVIEGVCINHDKTKTIFADSEQQDDSRMAPVAEAKKGCESTAQPTRTISDDHSSTFVDGNINKDVQQDIMNDDQVHPINRSNKKSRSVTVCSGMRKQIEPDLINRSSQSNDEESCLRIDQPVQNLCNTELSFDGSARNVKKSAVKLASKFDVDNTKSVRRIGARRMSAFVGSATNLSPVPLLTVGDAVQEINAACVLRTSDDANIRTTEDKHKHMYQQSALTCDVPLDMLKIRLRGNEKQTRMPSTSKQNMQRSKTTSPCELNAHLRLSTIHSQQPSIEFLLLHATNPSDTSNNKNELNGPKRRTTKNSQIAETVSKLFNIQEEIMLIDSTRRKPKKQPSSSTTMSQMEDTVETASSVIRMSSDEPKEGILLKSMTKAKVEETVIDPMVRADEQQNVVRSKNLTDLRTLSPSSQLSMKQNIVENSPNDNNEIMMNSLNNAREQSPLVRHDNQHTCEDIYTDHDALITTGKVPSTVKGHVGKGRKRKRRMSTLGGRSRRFQSKAKARDQSEDKQTPIFHCDLCRKVFKKQDTYNKHRGTLTHIAKLSEQEYIESQQKRVPENFEKHAEARDLHEESMVEHNSKQHTSCPSATDHKVMQSTSYTQPFKRKAKEIEKTEDSTVLHNHPQIKPTSTGREEKHSLTVLSQEEKLFYECCSLLKESNTPDKLNDSASLAPSPPAIMPNSSIKLDENQHSQSINKQATDTFAALVVSRESTAADSLQRQIVGKDVIKDDTIFKTYRVDCDSSKCTTKHRCRRLSSRLDEHGANGNKSCDHISTPNSTQSAVSSSNTKIKTKGALKGYDNLKVSIPMTGIIIAASNTEVETVNNKLFKKRNTMVEVNEPINVTMAGGSSGGGEQSVQASNIAQKSSNMQSHAIDGSHITYFDINSFQPAPCTEVGNSKTMNTKQASMKKDSIMISDSTAENNTQIINVGTRSYDSTPIDHSASSKIQQNLPVRANKIDGPLEAVASFGVAGSSETPDDDIYAFQEPSGEDLTPVAYSSKKNPEICGTSSKVQHTLELKLSPRSPGSGCREGSRVSSLSFSDRDDFEYGTTNPMSDEDVEEQQASSLSSCHSQPNEKTKPLVKTKSLIMGRIFKKGSKQGLGGDAINKDISSPLCIRPSLSTVDSAIVSMKKTEKFDKLFDKLKNSSRQENNQVEQPSSDFFPSDTSEDDAQMITQYSFTNFDEVELKTSPGASIRKKKITESCVPDQRTDLGTAKTRRVRGYYENENNEEKNLDAKGKRLRKSAHTASNGSKPDIEDIKAKCVEENCSELTVKPDLCILTENKQATTNLDNDALGCGTIPRHAERGIALENRVKSRNSAEWRGVPVGSSHMVQLTRRIANNITKKNNGGSAKKKAIGLTEDLKQKSKETCISCSDNEGTSSSESKSHKVRKLSLASCVPLVPNNLKSNNDGRSNTQNHTTKPRTKKVSQSTTENTLNINGIKSSGRLKSRAGKKRSFVGSKIASRGKLRQVTAGGSKQNKPAARKMKNVAYDPDSDYEHNTKYTKMIRNQLVSRRESNLKQMQPSANLDGGDIVPSTPRRKRNAGEMLYYWPSSSDEEEFHDKESGTVREKGKKTENTNQSQTSRLHTSSFREKQNSGSRKYLRYTYSNGLSMLGNYDNATGKASKHNVRRNSIGSEQEPYADLAHSTRHQNKVESLEGSNAQSIQNSPIIFVGEAVSHVDHESVDGISSMLFSCRKQEQLEKKRSPFRNDDLTDATPNSENKQQHGWIVGDSHKKLVTLLAHAKGKITSHRRK